MRSLLLALCALAACDSTPRPRPVARPEAPAAPPDAAGDPPRDQLVEQLHDVCRPEDLGLLGCYHAQQVMLRKGHRAELDKIGRDHRARCDAGDAEACYWAGRLVDAEEKGDAPLLLERACEGGFTRACPVIARQVYDASLRLADRTAMLEHVAQWLTLACDAALPDTCTDLAEVQCELAGRADCEI